ncbi:MAG TPA: hypothetical protein VGG27_02515 [Magnetospirillaceae bacterium]|jgi:hypothetical protein
MANVNETVVNYIAAWNEPDGKRRRDFIAKAWADGGSYVDAHRNGVGHDGLNAMIEKVQSQFPGYRLNLSGSIEAFPGHVRFSWQAGGQPNAPLFIAGSDFATLTEDNKLKVVAGFTDASPAPMG